MDQITPIRKLLDPAKFRDPLVTAKGEVRATVGLRALDTLWFNTGTLCNLPANTSSEHAKARPRPIQTRTSTWTTMVK